MTEPDSPEDWTDERRRSFREALRARQARQLRAGQAFALALVAIVATGILLRLPEAWWVPPVGAVALGGLVFRRLRSEVVEDQLARESAAFVTEMRQLRDELAQATADTTAYWRPAPMAG